MKKQIKLTEMAFRKQVRSVVREALQTLLEAEQERLKPDPVRPEDLMDSDDDDETPAPNSSHISVHKPGAAIAPVNLSDLTDDGDDEDFGYPAPTHSPSLADKFNDVGDDDEDGENHSDDEISPTDPDARKEWIRQRLIAKAPVIVKNGHYWRLGRDLGPVSDGYKESAESIAKYKRDNAEKAEKFAAMTPQEQKAARAAEKAARIKASKEGGDFDDVEPEGELSGSVMDRVEDLADKTGLTGDVDTKGKPVKKSMSRDANGGLNAKLEDIGNALGFTKEMARIIVKSAMDGLEQHAPAFSDLTDEEGNPIEGPPGTISYQDMPDIVFDAWESYKKSLKKAGLSQVELAEIENAVKKDPINMLVGHNHYLDDEEGKARVNAALRAGKISQSEAELMIKAIDELPAGESYDFNALRRSGVIGSKEDIADLKNLLKLGVWTSLSGRPLLNSQGKPIADDKGKPILDDNGKPISKPFQMDDEQEDEEFQDFRWHLVKALKQFKKENNLEPPSVARDAAAKAAKKAK